MAEFAFECKTCGETHHGIPSFGAPSPYFASQIPADEHEQRVSLGTDDCVVDEQYYFVRGLIEIPVYGHDIPFTWLAWVSLSFESYKLYVEYFEADKRSHVGPFFGWLASDFPPYEQSCLSLKTMVYLQDNFRRPIIQLEPTEHPLSLEQHHGISPERLIEICTICLHGNVD